MDALGRLAIRPPRDHHDAILEVSDTGQGMADEIAEPCFAPFCSSTPHGSHGGMGLSLASGVVRQSRRHIEAISLPRHGTAFEIRRPLAAGMTTARA